MPLMTVQNATSAALALATCNLFDRCRKDDRENKMLMFSMLRMGRPCGT
jgi:hypothetical protein